ncbi:DUF6586 family protein [Microbulbifer pacificus]|uniref:DUF6586 family protein n=1 Tax=Microbulbifer pacificus TaxID=407164 RepID=A0AAU0MXY0_9GAMM|nr:DUF6586 family protein [Microbulbifer pacificus]WOX05470.1 DUF6586 family protein [Microbulbifer pacificus]
MSNPYTGIVVSALRKSELLLQSLEVREAESNPLLQAALLEGTLLQLWRAHRAFLAEQGHQLQLGFKPAGEPDTALRLQEMAAARGKFSAEVAELVGLEENPDSWFNAMARCWQGLWRPAGGAQESGAANSGVRTLIPLRQLDSSFSASLDSESLRHWHRQLNELVVRQRAQGQEW